MQMKIQVINIKLLAQIHVIKWFLAVKAVIYGPYIVIIFLYKFTFSMVINKQSFEIFLFLKSSTSVLFLKCSHAPQNVFEK